MLLTNIQIMYLSCVLLNNIGIHTEFYYTDNNGYYCTNKRLGL